MTTIELIAVLTTLVARHPKCSTVEVRIPDFEGEPLPTVRPDYAHNESYQKGYQDAQSDTAGRWDFSVGADDTWPLVLITPTQQVSNP